MRLLAKISLCLAHELRDWLFAVVGIAGMAGIVAWTNASLLAVVPLAIVFLVIYILALFASARLLCETECSARGRGIRG